MNPYARVDIPLLLTRLGIKARNKGNKLEAVCPNPLHSDRSPSWFIRSLPGENLNGAHKCQACGWGGGARSLVEAVLGLDEAEAREWLKDFHKPVPLPNRVEFEIDPPRPATKQFSLPPCFKIEPLEKWPEAHREYFLGRLQPWQQERWEIGYVTDCFCTRKKNDSSAKKGRGRHANRIALPVADEQGVFRSYTSRSILSNEKLRYVEPLEAEGANRVLFGSYRWAGKRNVIVTEGIFDALAVEQLFEDEAVCALRGSSPRAQDLERLARFEKIIVLTDPDKAGKKARDAILAACSRHSEVLSVGLPEGEDPSDVCKIISGRNYLKNSILACLG